MATIRASHYQKAILSRRKMALNIVAKIGPEFEITVPLASPILVIERKNKKTPIP